MPTFDVDREPITVFPIGDRYLFNHYFEQDDLYGQLRGYYNEDAYRFEVPQDAFSDVEDLLHDHFFEPHMVDGVERFCVVYPKYTDHPEVLFKASVLQRSQGDQHLFLMKDQLSVEQAVTNGATRLDESDVEVDL